MCNYAPTAAARSDLDRVWVGLRRLKAQQDLAFLALALLTAQPGYPFLRHPCLNQLQSYWWRLTGMLERRTYRKLHMHPPSDPMLHGPHENSRNEDILHALESNCVILGLSVCSKVGSLSHSTARGSMRSGIGESPEVAAHRSHH